MLSSTNFGMSVVTVYIRSETQTRDSLRRTKKVVDLFQTKGLSMQQIDIVDVTPYPKLGSWLEGQSLQAEYPLVFVGDTWVGFLEDVEKANASGELEKLMKERLQKCLTAKSTMESSGYIGSLLNTMASAWSPSSALPPNLQYLTQPPDDGEEAEEVEAEEEREQAAIDTETTQSQNDTNNGPKPFSQRKMEDEFCELRCESGDESTESGLEEDSACSSSSSSSTSGVSARVASDSLSDFIKLKDEEFGDEDEVEIEVMRTNWFWRQQSRMLRFGKETFERIDPKTNETRAIFRYSAIDNISLKDDTNLVIRFTDGTEPQYMQAASIRKTRQIIHLLTERGASLGHMVYVLDGRGSGS
ncbi:hypothetical protein QOT17_019323 [Balamuthia mandrillaris]